MPDGTDALTKKFGEYMIKEIGNQAFEEKIKYSITAMINLEKRPQISIFEIIRYIAQMYHKYFTFNNTFVDYYTEKRKLKIEIYGKEWNDAYLKVVSDKIAENCYRNVAVNLLDRMVEKLLEMSFDMFNKENTLREQNKINDKIEKLNEIKSIIELYVVKNDNN